jgi:hypothetical protein
MYKIYVYVCMYVCMYVCEQGSVNCETKDTVTFEKSEFPGHVKILKILSEFHI